MKVVLDANVLVAAVATRGLCESLFELCLEEHDVFISEELIQEVQRALVEKIKLPDAVAAEFSRLLRNNATLKVPASVPKGTCRDPKDLYLLGLSESSKADFLVTGDKDLLECKHHRTTQIVTPRQFWEKCRKT